MIHSFETLDSPLFINSYYNILKFLTPKYLIFHYTNGYTFKRFFCVHQKVLKEICLLFFLTVDSQYCKPPIERTSRFYEQKSISLLFYSNKSLINPFCITNPPYSELSLLRTIFFIPQTKDISI